MTASLKPFNSFGIAAKASQIVVVETISELVEVLRSDEFKLAKEKLILGGGSNILITRDIEGIVLVTSLKGKQSEQFERDGKQMLRLKVMAGENWHELVRESVSEGWCGFENLALIPGSVGAAPMQNIGAYGVEIKQVVESVAYLDLETLELKYLDNAECKFGYRDSIFKQELKGKVIITEVTFVLSRDTAPNVSYEQLRVQLTSMGIIPEEATINQVYDAVVAVRSSKLPDPKLIGNAGSFFKNPVLPNLQFEQLKSNYPEIPSYPDKEGFTKVPAGWLIEQAGFKGIRKGDAGVHDKHALVLVNHGNATGHEILQLAGEIMAGVKDKFGVEISPEVNIVP